MKHAMTSLLATFNAEGVRMSTPERERPPPQQIQEGPEAKPAHMSQRPSAVPTLFSILEVGAETESFIPSRPSKALK